MNPPDETVRNALASQNRAWMVGHNARFDTARILPGWTVGSVHGIGKKNAVWLVTPPAHNPETR